MTNLHEALALAGGAAKRSFQVGALGYLYRLQRIAPRHHYRHVGWGREWHEAGGGNGDCRPF